MSDAVWPVSIPSEPEQGDYRETITPNLSSFTPDVGLPTSWRRSTLDSAEIQASFRLTYAQRDAFKTFFRDTLADGSRAFRWTNPAYGVEARYIFDPKSPPQFQPIGGALWRVGVSLIKVA